MSDPFRLATVVVDFRLQLNQYDIVQPSSNVRPTDAPAIPAENKPQLPLVEHVTPHASVDQASVHREEKIEYRDQDGQLLNEEEVSSLEGKVSFSTRYETRTRVLDAEGNEVEDSYAGTAPPHPADQEPETAIDEPEDDGRDYPATASPEDDLGKEKSVRKNDDGKPRPASEAKDATK